MIAALAIRPVRRDDVPVLFSLIVELAEYERSADRVEGSPALLESALFSEEPVAEAVIAERDGVPAGFALWYRSFSTWQCLPGIWLEDLYVSPAHRRGGIGRALLRHVAQVAVAKGAGRLEWSALDWNIPALSFYAALGSSILAEWRIHRLDGDALANLAGSE